jgi:hypothetical protein
VASEDKRDELDHLLDAARAYRLSPPAKRDLLVKARAGDTDAERDLLNSFLEMTILLAVEFAPGSWQLADAVQEGIVVMRSLIRDKDAGYPPLHIAAALHQRLVLDRHVAPNPRAGQDAGAHRRIR